jgi:hypothetical protein
MRELGEPNTSLTAVIGLVFAILLFVVVVLLQAFFYSSEQKENQRKVVAIAPQELSQVRAQQQEKLGAYKLLDPQKGVVAIPIDRAEELLLAADGKTPWPEVQPPPAPKPAPGASGRPDS